MQLHEQYRPIKLADVVGQEAAIATIEAVRPRGLAGRSWWVSGISGAGKTTLARIIALEVAEDLNIDELDATEVTAGELREIEIKIRTKGMNDGTGKDGRAVLINEAHGLSKKAIRHLLVMLERLPAHAVVIFTTTVEGQASLFEDYDDALPLLSRCTKLELSRRGLAKPFAERVYAIAKSEKLVNGKKELKHFEQLAKDERNNMRAMLGRVEAGEML